jgi:hypothetical protein
MEGKVLYFPCSLTSAPFVPQASSRKSAKGGRDRNMVRADRDRMAAAKLRAIDQETAEVRRAQAIFWLALEAGRISVAGVADFQGSHERPGTSARPLEQSRKPTTRARRQLSPTPAWSQPRLRSIVRWIGRSCAHHGADRVGWEAASGHLPRTPNFPHTPNFGAQCLPLTASSAA